MGVWLLATQKPINRTGWWKGKLALFQMPATRSGRADVCPKVDSPFTDNQWGKSFIYRRRGLYAEIAQLPLTVILKLIIGGLICGERQGLQ